MRKIIKQLCYDTDTARKCGEYSEGSPGDTMYLIERLMLKRSGEFFLWAYGGKHTKYSKLVSSDTIEQELIIPLSVDAARAWAEECLDGTGYEELFGVVPESADNGKEVLSINIDRGIAQRVRQLAREQHKSISAIVEEQLRGI